MPNPRISIVVPVWNEEPRIGKCLESLQGQIFTDFEVIVVNDGSTDDSKRVIQSFCDKDARFKYYEMPTNSGIGTTLNFGFEQTKADLLTWTSADSWVNPDYLSELKKALDNNPDKIMAYSNWFVHDELDGGKETTIFVPEYNKKKLQIQCRVGPCWLFRREAKEKAGPYCPEICEDYYMHLLMSGFGDFIKVDKVLGCWRNHKLNTTNRVNMPNRWYMSSVVKARARWKQAKYKVACLCPNLDAASVGWILTTTINDLSDDFAVRHILGDTTHLTPGIDLKLYDEETKNVLRESDIVHINNEYPDLKPEFFEIIKDRPIVIHLHAGPKQWHIEKMQHWLNQGYDVYSCTPGHELAKWIPNFVPISNGLDITYEEYFTPTYRNNSKLKFICHHNYVAGKGTIQLNDVITSMDRIFYQYKIHELMEWSISGELKMPLFDHLMLKKHVDVCFDTITHGYCGMATWESMAQATAVICKMDDLAMKEYKDFFGSVPPIMNVRIIDDAVNHIRKLISNKSLSKEMGQANREWMMQNYTAEKILDLHERIYIKAINGRIQQRQSPVPYRETHHFEKWGTAIPNSRPSDYIRLL